MNCLLTFFFLLSALLSTGVHAQGKASQQRDKDALAQWVQANAQTPLSPSKATSIVKHAYVNAFKNEMDPLLILSVIKVESGYRDKAVSPYGARGIAQVVPRWHKDKIKGRSLTNTAVSIEVGSQVLKDCSDKHRGNIRKALGCYSGGGGKKYYNKVMAQKKSMRQDVMASQNRSRPPLYAAL